MKNHLMKHGHGAGLRGTTLCNRVVSVATGDWKLVDAQTLASRVDACSQCLRVYDRNSRISSERTELLAQGREWRTGSRA